VPGYANFDIPLLPALYPNSSGMDLDSPDTYPESSGTCPESSGAHPASPD
jgi:hypothetical protein